MVFVSRKKGETKDAIFRKFSKMFMEENIVDELRKKQFYKKPSLKKRDDEKERIKMRIRRRKGYSYLRSNTRGLTRPK
ncbi:30S ribosomal protein S21 [Candidatus Roizmanbacteria bacterium CG_4_10_14_0_8_um_filter_39_9]|uniref:Small ribosomal subunit protein bS21 n=1 Tax=Candidatus Roizmanbacteria bacterium CG_4_10_14_0_8_um_filter_39_9 TaxID=1974829 RepID=A0A2M7QDP8_9BACT|nr:MAG: 30S ribosomal protein S21 [Candidatus Roizmanbacteria bacterium CG_4_10_14_0_8_um_filter_39_9]